MSSSRYLTLDWRSCPSTTEIITRLEKFLGTMDAQGQAGVVNSRAKASVLVEDGGVRMMLRPANAFSVYKSGKLHFWHRMFRIAETLGNLMGNSDEPMDRFLQYREVSRLPVKAPIACCTPLIRSWTYSPSLLSSAFQAAPCGRSRTQSRIWL